MQTLPTGSFLRLENDSAVESLKFTARLLAEHTEKVVKENLQSAALENLANNLWQKAEYVTLDAERRRLQKIFVENFTERFRELKPDFDALTNEIAGLLDQAAAPEKVEKRSEQAIAQPNASPMQQSSEVPANKDEFLGLVSSSELLSETAVEETKVATAATQEVNQTIVQTEDVKTESESAAAETAVPENEKVSRNTETARENSKADKPQTTAQTNTSTTTQATSGTSSLSAKEPFEFGKCTVNLNLVLLPYSGNEASRRKAIISTVSHQLPPEIEYLEIDEGEDLERIAALVKDKLSRFRAALPVKYIEQLRASKTKTTKTNQTSKSTPSPVNNQANVEKTSGEQNTSSAANIEGEVNVQAQASATAGETASIVSPPVASSSNTQPGLF